MEYFPKNLTLQADAQPSKVPYSLWRNHFIPGIVQRVAVLVVHGADLGEQVGELVLVSILQELERRLLQGERSLLLERLLL